MIDSQFDNGFAQGIVYGASLQSSKPEHWLSVKHDGQPSAGFYPGLYLRNGNLISGMFSYNPPGEDNDSIAGWAEFTDGDGEEFGEIPRDVVAYLPMNFDMASLKAVRARFGSEK